VVGTGLIWIPAVVLLIVQDSLLKAMLVAVGFVAVTAFATALYPMLVGNRLKQHTIVVFVAAIGGIVVFGPVGFILGPVIVAVTLGLLEVLQTRLKEPA
jgi:predicted PurR-regulated permease PerM